MKNVWEGMHLVSGYKRKREVVLGMNTKTAKGANALNDFYACFDCHDFSEARNNLEARNNFMDRLRRGEYITMTEDEVF